DDCDQAEWTALLARAQLPTLEQCWAYGTAIEAVSSYRARRGIASVGDEPVAMLQVFSRAIGPVTLTKALRGPLWLGTPDSAAMMMRVLDPMVRRLRLWQRRPFLWLPELPGADADVVMRALGKRPMVRGYATSMLDLTQDEATLRAALDGKW